MANEGGGNVGLARRVLDEQKRHNYLNLRRDNVDPSHTVPLPDALLPPGA